LSAGRGTVQVRTVVAAGTVTTGTGQGYTVDAAAPTAVATVTALSSDTGSSSSDFITDVASQTVSGTYSGTLGSGETIQVSVNGTTWINATAAAGTWSASGITLSAGTRPLPVRTADTARPVTDPTPHAH